MPDAPVVLAGALFFAVLVVYLSRRPTSEKDDVAIVPGPPSDSFLSGNMYTLAESPSDAISTTWAKSYGGIVKLNGVLGVRKHVLLISDPAALRRIFGSGSGQWDLSPRNLANNKNLFGPGIAAVGGADHARQRRVVAQAMTPVQVKEMVEPARVVSKALSKALRKACTTNGNAKPVKLNMLDWARRGALDSLTTLAFGVSFDAIHEPEKTHDLMHTFDSMLEDCIGKSSPLRYFLRETATAGIYPSLLAILLTNPGFFQSMFGTFKRLGEASEWVRKTRAEVEGGGVDASANRIGGGADLLSLLESSNKEDAKYRLYDDEVKAQIGMILFAGHDTVSTTLSMFLNDMALYPAVQQRLRDEIRAKQVEIGEGVEFEQEHFDSMEYLNAVLKESMRLSPALGQGFRTNASADVLPLSSPIIGLDGKEHNEIAVSAGTFVVIDVTTANRRQDIWGEDAEVFRAERWLEEGEEKVPRGKTPGVVYGGLLNFLAGNRTCPGWRVAVLELQTFICDIVLNFKISPVPGVHVIREFHGVSIPKVEDAPIKGGEVPLMLEAIS